VAMAIIAGLTTVSVMSTTDYVNQNRVKQVAYEFKNSVALARSEAIKRDKIVRLRHLGQISGEPTWMDISAGWHIYSGNSLNPPVIFKYETLSDLTVAGDARVGVVFRSKTGELKLSKESSSKTVCFTGGGITYSVEVSSLGIATVDASNGCS
ncbi:GspH/FimT family pseudopilin, partial [Porticoccaceae bacterium]|nr:GspH/FimT family pseudopilin [Porticoccaceae bacterium]